MTIWRAAAPSALVLAFVMTACAAPRAAPEAPLDRISRVEHGLLTSVVVPGEPGLSIDDRLRFYRVPGVSVAVIDRGRIAWARGWGVVEAGSATPVDTSTLFQAASISKPVTAIAALRLVERRQLDLDGDVNQWLDSWQVPESPHTTAQKVTLRRLLSHSAGTTVHGFPGYAAGDPVPTLVQVLDGEAPANTAPVRVDTVPGSRWRYSGGGTSIVQLVLMDVTGRPFPRLMRELVLEPAGMHHSTFEQPLPPDRRDDAATAHDGDGDPVAGRFHAYPEMAAAGLWTTPSDLARLAMEVQRAFAGERDRVLSPESVRRMLAPQAGSYGLGFGLDIEGDALWFTHGGSNRGFRSFFAALAGEGSGAAIMTNGDGGSALAMEILRAIATEYGWPGFRPTERKAITLDPMRLPELTGSYRADWRGREDGLLIEVGEDAGHLRLTIPTFGVSDWSLRAAAPDTFFLLERPAELRFERDATGAARAVVLSGFLDEPLRAERR